MGLFGWFCVRFFEYVGCFFPLGYCVSVWVGEFGLFQEGLLVCFFKGKNTLNIFQIFFSFHLNDTLGIFRRGLIWYSETNDWLVNEQ